ncbi:MAG: hypothetical protein KKD73_07805 [Proteobacteria bacterium]|nr:hypothetical protein [Pseudomonadota bacterium]
MLNKIALITLFSLSLIMSGCASWQSAQINELLTPQEKQQAEKAIARAFADADSYFSSGDTILVGDQSFHLKFSRPKERNDTPVLRGVVNAIAFVGTLGIIPFCERYSTVYTSNIRDIGYVSSYEDCIGWLPMKQEREKISPEDLAHDNVDKILYDLFDQDYLSLDKVKR